MRLIKLFRTDRRLAKIWANGVTMRSSPWLQEFNKIILLIKIERIFANIKTQKLHSSTNLLNYLKKTIEEAKEIHTTTRSVKYKTKQMEGAKVTVLQDAYEMRVIV